MQKFNIKDKVRLTGRVPARLDFTAAELSRPRTIIGTRYDREKQCTFYRLGSNARGRNQGDGNPQNGMEYEFRSYQMKLYEPRPYKLKSRKGK